MPVLTRENLAMRLRQNWLTKHPMDLCGSAANLDDSLTSLSWLQNLNIMKITTPTPPPSPQAGDVLTSLHFTGNMQVNPNAILNMTHLPCRIKQEPGLVPQSHVGCLEMAPSAINGTIDTLDYKSNAYVKPPYSYATLICMAMKESNLKKITLSGIYTWITENFMYYKVADPSWQNSIRHNLSLNKSFQKVARRKDEPGKGGFWRINPECEGMFDGNGIFKKRRNCTLGHRDVIMPLAKRIKREGDEVSNGSTGSSFDEDSSCADNDLTHGLHPSDAETKAATDGILHISDGMVQPMDFSLNAILHQDIEVGGVKVKTEDIIDERDAVSNSITSLSPPPSDTNSEVDLMDLLCRDLGVDLDTPLDLSSGDALDLSVTGISLRAPGWWSETINASKELTEREKHDSGLHTPIAQSPVPDHNLSHPWEESHYDLGQSFDAGVIPSLFDLGTLSSNNAES